MLQHRVGTKEARDSGIDLHMHSTVSDGSMSSAELIDRAVQCGLSAIAITDHDTLDGLAALSRLAAQAPLKVIGGIEISACDTATGRKVHILGYGLLSPTGESAVEKFVAPTLAARSENSIWQVDRLIEAGYDLALDEVLATANPSTGVYKQHIMEALCHLPYNDPEYQELYRSLFKGDGVAARDISYPDARDAVTAIRADGGCAVLAHPGQSEVFDIVPDLIEVGLGGIEKMHPDHSAADIEKVDRLAARYGLIETGGSDFHGRYGSPLAPGVRTVARGDRTPQLLDLLSSEA